MKKLITTPKWKKYLLRRSEYRSKRRTKLKKPLISISEYSQSRSNKKTFAFHQHKAPDNFSLVNNPEEIIKYFDEALGFYENGLKVHFDLREINELTPDAIAFHVAFINEPRFTKKLGTKGTSPTNSQFSQMFLESGFYDHVNSDAPKNNAKRNALLHRITEYKVENQLAKELCEKAVRFTFGNDTKFHPIYEILIECMANTNNHAAKRKKGKYNWWVFEYNDPKTKITSFTFLDFGVGIFKSLSVQTFLRGLTNIAGLSKNVNLVSKLMAGEISSRTGLAERGKGLPLIFDHSKNPKIGASIIISNDVFADLKGEKYFALKNHFPGTLLYWELIP